MNNEYETIIIGAGPGGLMAAEELARHGRSVVVLEKNQEVGPKVCAGGLTTKVKNLGISLDLVERQFSSIKAHHKDKLYTVSSDRPVIATLDRKKLGQYMQTRAVKAGAEIQTSAKVTKITADDITVNNQQIKYKYLIGADGSLSLVRQYLGLPTKKIMTCLQYIVPQEFTDLEVFMDAGLFGASYIWIFPHQGYASIGIGQEINHLPKNGLKQILQDWCEKMQIDLTQAKEEAWLINYDYRGWQFKNIFLVGDAGGFTPGLTGEGIYYAMISGQEAAIKILNPNYACPRVSNILKKKNRQERLLAFMNINRRCANMCYRTLLWCTKYTRLAKKIISLFD